MKNFLREIEKDVRLQLTTPKHTSAAFLAALCIGATVSHGQSVQLDGGWIAASAVSTGVLSDRYIDRVEPFEKLPLTIDGHTIRLSGNLDCMLSQPYPEVWVNDLATFGTFGGDWSDLGLFTSNGRQFEVIRLDIDCPDTEWPQLSVVVQPQYGVVLLGSFRVFVRLTRTK